MSEEVLGTWPWVDLSSGDTCHFIQGFGQGSERVWPLAQGTQPPRERAEVSTVAPDMLALSPSFKATKTRIFLRAKREAFVQGKEPGQGSHISSAPLGLPAAYASVSLCWGCNSDGIHEPW